MKKIFLLSVGIAFSVLTAAVPAMAQYNRRPANNPANNKNAVIKLNVLSPFVLTGSGFFEYAFSQKISGQLGAFATGANISDVSFSGYGFTPEMRYYLSADRFAPAGPYVAGYARFQNFDLTVERNDGEDYRASYSPIGAGIAGGNQWIFNSGITLDLFFGAGFNAGKLRINTGTEDDFDLGFLDFFGSGFRIRPGIAVGYNF